MSTKNEPLRVAASQSFTHEEVEQTAALFDCLRRGGDARVLARAPGVQRVSQKFASMRTKVRDLAEQRLQSKPIARRGTPVSGTDEP